MYPLKSMYDIRVEHLALIQTIEDNDGMFTPEMAQALTLTEEEFQSKAISYGFIIKSFDDIQNTITNEIDRLMALKKKASNRYELFKEKLDEAMKQFRIEKIISPTLTISYRKSESIEISDEALLPDEFKKEKIEISPDKQKIKHYIKEGNIVPGATLVTKNNLQIK